MFNRRLLRIRVDQLCQLLQGVQNGLSVAEIFLRWGRMVVALREDYSRVKHNTRPGPKHDLRFQLENIVNICCRGGLWFHGRIRFRRRGLNPGLLVRFAGAARAEAEIGCDFLDDLGADGPLMQGVCVHQGGIANVVDQPRRSAGIKNDAGQSFPGKISSRLPDAPANCNLRSM